MRVSVIGLGKLGCPLAALLAAKGHTVIGADLSPELVAMVNAGKAPFEEPMLQEYLTLAGSRLSATVSVEEAALATDASMIIVPTPSLPDGTFSNSFLLGAIEAIGRGLRRKDGYHLVVVISTVMPGSCDGEVRTAIEAHSGRVLGESLGLCYGPEFVALGNVFRNMLAPDMVLIGQSDETAGDRLAAIYQSVVENTPAVCRMNLVNAELTKLSVDTYVTTKISFANMLSEMCEHLPEADVATVTEAMGMVQGIGDKCLKGAIGYGGPCFPRDNKALGALAQRLGTQSLISDATDAINSRQIWRLVAAVEAAISEGGRTVAVLGLAYKPGTSVIEESQSVALVRLLIKAGHRVVIYDPVAMAAARDALPGAIPVATAEEAVAKADVVVISTAWQEFETILPQILQHSDRLITVIDPWRVLPVSSHIEPLKVVTLGRGGRKF